MSTAIDQASAKDSLRRAGSFSRQKKNRGGDDGKAGQDYSEDALANPARQVAELTSPQDKLNEVVAKEAVELFDQGKYDEAGEKWWGLAEHARASGNASQECTALHNVGTALVMMHELTEAVTCYNKALQVAVDSEDRAAQVELFECLAWVYRELGHAPHAVECLESLLMLHREADNKPGQVLATCGLGSIHDAAGHFSEAAGFYETALELAKETGDEKAVARVLGDLGTACVQVGEYDKGVAAYEQALAMAQAEGDRDREMRTYGNLAIAANLREKDEEAVDFFTKTLALAKELGEAATELRARSDLALVLRALGRVDEAVAAFEEAVSLAKAQSDVVALGDNLCHLGVTQLKHKGDVAAARPALEESVATWRECAGILRGRYCETRVSAQQRNADNLETAEFFDARMEAFVLLQSVLVDLGEEAAALAVAEEAHAIATRELVALGGLDYRSVGQLLAAGAEAKTDLDAPVSAEGVSAVAARTGATFLMLTLSGDKEALAWIVAPGAGASPRCAKLDMTAALDAAECSSVVHAVSRLHEAIATSAAALKCRGASSASDEDGAAPAPPTAEATAEAASSARKMLGALHAALIAPIAADLEGAAELVVCPSGVLSLVPFAALAPVEDPQRPLISTLPVCTAPSIATYEALLGRARPAAGGAALVVGDAEPLPTLALKGIPAAREEATAVAEALKAVEGLETTLLAGADAKSRTVLEALVRDPPAVLHFAAHAQPKCVALTPAKEAGAEGAPDEEEDDGLLHKDQVHLTWLSAHPVVAIVGSHSGGGDLCEDGVLGLPRAFVAAGARCVLSSLWAVPDESAKRLMVNWYREGVSGKAPSLAVALQRATCAAAQRPDGTWEEAVHWAGFTLLGNSSSF
mmetsp:Transcript_28065/g.75591  ORF Transcript_28065/g.75591 Transcript_28065/m.75591 type:complete len:875 (-) Transcript_28065:410-3034(-)